MPKLTEVTQEPLREPRVKLTVESRPVPLALIQELPLFDCPIKAGFPSPAEDYSEGKLDLNQHLVSHPAATYFVRVSGDSMKGAGIFDGDLVIVDASVEPKNGDIVVAVLEGEMTLKRLKRNGSRVLLMPENSAYPVIEIQPEDNLTIWGVVKNSIHYH